MTYCANLISQVLKHMKHKKAVNWLCV